ncbi:MAG: superoxide dismutase [Bacilli bacterium]|nr:superoxide dismutase [Bacilli bacterium]MDD4808495.1 superoxide dismutase [Bacilli bacterium]
MYKKKELNYSYEALEPFIDTHTMGVHYNKHYLNYLKNLNNILTKYNYQENYSKVELLRHLEIFKEEDIENLLFNLGGVINHELYWDSISDKGNNTPIKEIKEVIGSKYGSYDNFKKEFTDAAMTLKGSGYTFLVINPANELEIMSLSNQLTPYLNSYIPIMTIDMWEHAYYLNYQNNKKLYIENFFDIIDFDKINNKYNEYKKQ